MDNYLRVSEILSPFTGIEFVSDELLNPAADRGTKVHECIEDRLNMKLTDSLIDQDCLPYLDSFDMFWHSSSHIFDGCKMELEKRFFDDNLQITGKVDAIFFKPGRTYLLDWKTSSRFQTHYYLQGAAYQHLARINGYNNVDEVLFVHLKKGKKPTTYKDSNPKKSLDLFLKCLELFRYFEMDTTRRKNGTSIK